MSEPILSIRGVSKRFDTLIAVADVDLDVAQGEKLGIIGPNGSGKTTLINCITGVVRPEQGKITFEGVDVSRMPTYRRARRGIARSFQIPRPFKNQTVIENIEVPLMFAVGHRDPDQIEAKAEAILAQIGLSGRRNDSPKSLTQVDLRKLELGRALAAEPRVLIADESMAGLSDPEVDEILEVLFKLSADGISIVLIEHIMRTVVRFSQRIVVLVAGKKIADGDPHEVMSHPEVERAYLGQ